MKRFVVLLLVITLVFSLCACGKKADDETPVTNTEATKAPDTNTGNEATKAPDEDNPTAAPEAEWDGAYIGRDDFRAYYVHDLETLFKSIEDQLDDTEYDTVKSIIENGTEAINQAGTVKDIEQAYNDANTAIINAIPVADGLYAYKKESNAERTNILGIMEDFAISKGLTGLSLYENGRYSIYNERLTLGTENYITGYGFGLLKEGSVTADLESETNPAWKRYYHTFNENDPGTLNALNDTGSEVADLYSYIGAGYYNTKMNATKDGYEWIPELAKEKPEPVNDTDGDGMCDIWRVEVRTGKDGLKYKSGSEIASRKAFDGRDVALEDYATSYKLLLTQANQYSRGSEFANDTGNTGVKGAKEFYDGTADGFNEELWNNVGIKTYEENGKSYIEFSFLGEETQFYVMYNLCPDIYMPVPQDFLNLVTPKNYLGFSADGKETPLDNSLSLGPYYVERYDSDQQIVYAKNPYYVYADTQYSIPGVYIKIFPAGDSDPNAAMKEFLAGHFDSCAVPQDYINEYKNDPRTRKAKGDSVYKLNVNACDQKTWEYLFGEDGFVTKNSKSEFWDLKPCLANPHFRKAISLSVNRQQFGDARGSIGSVEFYSSNYMSDPENGISYDSTDAHKKAINQLLEDTDGYGYSLELAREYFRLALTELEKDGAYTPGTKDKPTEIEIEIAWMTPGQEEEFHKELKNYLETAFNDDSVCGGVYKLNVKFWAGATWSDVYDIKILVGMFDIGFGSIGGAELDPFGLMNILSCDQSISNNLTLNWSIDTNSPDYLLVYEGKRFSYDALYNALNGQAIVSQGANKPIIKFEYTEIKKNDDGSYSGSIKMTPSLPDITSFTPEAIMCCNYDRYYNGDGQYVENEVLFTAENGDDGSITVNFTVPAEIAVEYTTGEGLPEKPNGSTGFDIYYSLNFNENVSDTYYSFNDYFQVG